MYMSELLLSIRLSFLDSHDSSLSEDATSGGGGGVGQACVDCVMNV